MRTNIMHLAWPLRSKNGYAYCFSSENVMPEVYTSMKHPVEDLRFPEASVEAVTEFRQVTGKVLWADTMMDTTNIAFDIGDQGVDQGRTFGANFPEPGKSHSWR
jgi:hypothetical protein